MIQTKYDWSGTADGKKFANNDGEKFAASIFGGLKAPTKKSAPKKSAPKKKATWY